MASPRKPGDCIELDGGTLEGGGQLMRIALCLSALTGTAIKITNIRGNRSGGGGLKAQHLACVKWLAQACNAHVEGGEKGSKTLLFAPQALPAGSEVPSVFRKNTRKSGDQFWETRLDIGTAGSTGLALQAVLPFILFKKLPGNLPIHLTLSGGTNVSGSPSYDYIVEVLLPALSNIGFPGIKAVLGKRGWAHGGTNIGNFTLEIPCTTRLPLPAFNLTQRDKPGKNVERRRLAVLPSRLSATVIAPSAYKDHFSDRLDTALKIYYSLGAISLDVEYVDSKHEKRFYLLLVASISTDPTVAAYTYLGRDWLYDRKIRDGQQARVVEEMCGRVMKELVEEVRSKACVDEHLRDQMVIFQALAEGRSVVEAGNVENGDGEMVEREPSLHARTAEWVCREMLGVRYAHGTCDGVAYGKEIGAELAQTAGRLALDDRDT